MVKKQLRVYKARFNEFKSDMKERRENFDAKQTWADIKSGRILEPKPRKRWIDRDIKRMEMSPAQAFNYEAKLRRQGVDVNPEEDRFFITVASVVMVAFLAICAFWVLKIMFSMLVLLTRTIPFIQDNHQWSSMYDAFRVHVTPSTYAEMPWLIEGQMRMIQRLILNNHHIGIAWELLPAYAAMIALIALTVVIALFIAKRTLWYPVFSRKWHNIVLWGNIGLFVVMSIVGTLLLFKGWSELRSLEIAADHGLYFFAWPILYGITNPIGAISGIVIFVFAVVFLYSQYLTGWSLSKITKEDIRQQQREENLQKIREDIDRRERRRRGTDWFS